MATTASVKHTIDQMNSFLRGELAAAETYVQAMTRAKTDLIKEELTECRRSHEERARLLRARILELGGAPAESSGAWGAFAHAVEGAASAVGESAAIAALEEGEDHGLKGYRADLTSLDDESKRLVETKLLPAQVKTHRTLSSLKMAMHP